MYDAMERGDCVTFDITHSFRSMPALFFPLMSYAKEMKQITVDHIFYGPYDNVTKRPKVIDLNLRAHHDMLQRGAQLHPHGV